MHYHDIDVSYLIKTAELAGKAVMEIYKTDFTVEEKDDKTPVTLADRKSNEVIIYSLRQRYNDIPIISEENKAISYDERKHWNRVWIVDPIDGTKEFIKKNGEFTVNIALVEDGQPMLGVVHAPALNKTYFGVSGLGSFRKNEDGVINRIDKPSDNFANTLRVVASRSHMDERTNLYINKLREKGLQVDLVNAGSSLKFCLVAEGTADVYPRFGPTMEWDTAAAHAVALYAGRKITNAETGEPLLYNKENLLNPFFIVE